MKTRLACLFPAAILLSSVTSFAQAPVVAPGVGDLTFSEVMFNPICVADNDGEWFEVTNISGKVLDLNGLYFQDGYTAGASGDKYFQILPSVATLPPLYPGQRFVIARKANPTLNNGLPQVDYEYAAATDVVPADKSQIGATQMNMGNSNPDGMHISVGNAVFFGGTVIASTSYVPSSAPVFPSDGISYEAIDLYIPMVAPGVTQNSANLAQPTMTSLYGTCLPQERGTPGTKNSVDATVWQGYITYNDTLSENTGNLTPRSPVSLATGSVTFDITNAPPLESYTLGIADDRSELPLTLLFAGWTGAILLDLNTANYLYNSLDPAYVLDSAGTGQLTVAVPNTPFLIGLDFDLQWLAFDSFAGAVRASHGLELVVAP